MDFCRKLRLAVSFYNLRKQTTVITPENDPENENNERNQHNNDYYDDSEPWTKKSNFNSVPGQNEALEEFILEPENYLFDPSNTRKVRDNLTQDELQCLKEMSTWNQDENCDKMFRVQDKGPD